MVPEPGSKVAPKTLKFKERNLRFSVHEKGVDPFPIGSMYGISLGFQTPSEEVFGAKKISRTPSEEVFGRLGYLPSFTIKNKPNVGKYTSPMDAMGFGNYHNQLPIVKLLGV